MSENNVIESSFGEDRGDDAESTTELLRISNHPRWREVPFSADQGQGSDLVEPCTVTPLISEPEDECELFHIADHSDWQPLPLSGVRKDPEHSIDECQTLVFSRAARDAAASSVKSNVVLFTGEFHAEFLPSDGMFQYVDSVKMPLGSTIHEAEEVLKRHDLKWDYSDDDPGPIAG